MLSVIIPTEGVEQPAVATLAALVPGAAAGVIREVLLVDRAGTGVIERVADVAGCRFLAFEGTRAAALAAGARAARSPWLMFLHAGARFIRPSASAWTTRSSCCPRSMTSRTAGESDRQAIALGLQRSARVIAAAALIMISVFSSFILNGDPVVKQFGVGLSSAVALAATMVLMLAPAVLTMLGKWAWWFPDALGRVVPTIDVEGTSLTDGAVPPASVPSSPPAGAP